MNNYNRPAAIFEDSHTSWMNNVVNNMNASVVGVGTGTTSISTPVGQVHNNLIPQINNAKLNFVGTYDETKNYYPNDVVFVDPNVHYTASFSGSAHNPPLVAGLFVCNTFCPANYLTATFFISNIVPSYTAIGANAGNETANAYQWTSYNKYYPTYPPIPQSSASVVLDGSGYSINANTNYWTALMPMSPFVVCNGANTQVIYMAGVISGSTFIKSYLPYTI